ncbi:hypothetical protein [Nitrogeniibacter aestuarii]|uniref:hypothetical protein n=1 Tax=Nitrogeniibacter aestuarii TaxID=2815343 RepID=UPI001E5C5B91|nr:hypothetical protein [Nitrogeniibacter aestuarii]
MKLLRLTPVLVALSAAATAHAVPPAEADLDELASMYALHALYENYAVACRHNMGAGHPSKTVDPETGTYGGIPPGSPEWNQLVQAFESYVATMCDSMSADYFVAEQKALWRETLDGDALKSTLSFYRTAAGARFLNGANASVAQLQARIDQKVARDTEEASQRFQAETYEIVRQYAERNTPWWQVWLDVIVRIVRAVF